MKKVFYLFSVLVLLLTGCVNDKFSEGITGSRGGASAVFHAAIQGLESDTRTYVDPDLYMYWTKDDRISIFTTTYNQEYRFTGESGDNSGDFEEVPTSGFHSGTEVKTNYAVYPYGAGTRVSKDGTLSVTLPSEQKYGRNTFGVNANTMVAVTEGLDDHYLSFKNVCGYLVVMLYGDAMVTSVTLRGNNGEAIAGPAGITTGSEAPKVMMDGDKATGAITVDCGDGVELGSTEGEATAFWFCVPPTEFTKGITVTAVTADGTGFSKSTGNAVSVTRNRISTMAPLKYETNGDNVVFADVNFKAYCVANFDTDGDGEISLEEATAVTEMHVSTDNIQSIEGIKAFKNLQDLSVYGSGAIWRSEDGLSIFGRGKSDGISFQEGEYGVKAKGQLKRIDVSGMDKLSDLYIDANVLESLDVFGCTSLNRLECEYTTLTTLDVSGCTALKSLLCYLNQLTTLDVSKNTALTYLGCYLNQLTTLDVSKNTALTYLDCSGNQLVTLDVSKNTALRSLECQINQLTTLDVTGCTALSSLHCHHNQLSTLDVSKNIALTSLDCYDNQLSTLDVSKNTILKDLNCENNPSLTEIWLRSGQTIQTFKYDTGIATIKYRNEEVPVDLSLVASKFTELQQSVYYNYNGAAWEFQIMQNLTSDQWVGYMGSIWGYDNSTTNLIYNDGWTSYQWTETYNHVMWPFTNIIKPSTDNDKYYYLYAPMLVIKVIAMSRVCDYYGPVIYTQYGNDNIDPEFDSVQEAYNAFFADLDDAMEKLDSYKGQFPGNKLFEKYDEWCRGNFFNWCKLINSVRLRLAMHIVKADPALAKTQAEKAAANKYGFLETYDVMERGVSWTHPLYTITDWSQTSMGATIESFITGYNDPRGFKWFTMTKNIEALKAGRWFMSIRSGIEPNNIYTNAYQECISWYGMDQYAPGYIFSAAEAYFLRAEGALRGWSGMGGTVQELYEKGVQASFNQWGCGSAADYLQSTAVPADYVDWINPSISAKAVNTLCPKWDDSASNEVKLERIIDQKYIAMWPESMEAWATLRRTGYPKQLPVVYNGNPTVFKDDDIVRRCLFPASLHTSNPQGYAGAVQSLGGPDAGNTRLWWDVESEGNF